MHKKIDSNIGMSFFGLKFQAGGYWEKPGQRGTSHLMEHLMCKTYEHLYPKMRELGVDDNAYTSDNSVVFFCSGLDECVSQISGTILDALTTQKNLWTEEEFETEKKIVLQEYNDCFNEQIAGTFENLFRQHYNHCGSIGFRKDIENFTYQDSIDTAKNVFSKPSLIVEAGGHNVTYNGEFSNKQLNTTAVFGNYDIELENVIKDDQVVVSLLSKNTRSIECASLLRLLETCICGGLESPLYQEMREKRGLVYAVYLWKRVMGNNTIPVALTQTSSENQGEVVKEFKKFFSRDMGDIISRERFETCKRGELYSKKKDDLLPHESVWSTVLADYNPYEGIDEFTYEDAIELANSVYALDNFEVKVY